MHICIVWTLDPRDIAPINGSHAALASHFTALCRGIAALVILGAPIGLTLLAQSGWL